MQHAARGNPHAWQHSGAQHAPAAGLPGAHSRQRVAQRAVIEDCQLGQLCGSV
jgi:hypothetical protein